MKKLLPIIAAFGIFLLAFLPTSADAVIARHANTTAVQAASAGTATITFTTTVATVIVCTMHSLDTGLPVVTGFAGGGLTWTRVGTAVVSASLNIGNGAARQSIDTFIAVAASAVTAQVFTATYSPIYNAATINCTAWTGVDTTTPLDPNASLPKTAANGTTSPTATTATGVSTTNTAPVIIGIMGTQDANTPVQGTGYTLDVGNVNGNSFSNETIGVQHQIFASAQSSVAVPFSAAVTNADWLYVVIALQSSGGGPPATPGYRSLLGAGR
jgi:hypothetical protein